METHQQIDSELDIEIDEETYEIKAIKAYIAKEISSADLQASLELGRAQTFRRVERYKRLGAAGLESRKNGNRNRASSEQERERIIKIVREEFIDFGPTFAAEKLQKNHGIFVAAETLRLWMMKEGIWVDRRGRKPKVFSPRKPREQRGELIQVDGSYHRWFEKRGDEACLIVFIDDATSEIQLLRLVDHESSYNYMACLRAYINKFGCPLALYSDRHSIFRVNRENQNGERTTTQFTRACGNLGITVICAKTPQAKGRVERANRTLQDRLVKELRLRNISTVVEANVYFEEYRLEHNARFARLPENPVDAHRPKPNEGLEKLLTYTVQRKVFKDLSLSFNKMKLILDDTDLSRRAIGKLVVVAMSLEGDLEVTFDETPLPFRIFDKIRRIDDHSPAIVDHKRLGAALALAKTICEVEPHHFQRNSHVMAGFRNHFRQPEDPRSRTLRDAPKEIRIKHNGRARAPLARHPVVILEERLTTLANRYEESGQKLKSETRRVRPKRTYRRSAERLLRST